MDRIKRLLPWSFAGLLLIALSFFQWILIEYLTPFIMPFVWLAAYGFFIVVIIFSIIILFKTKDWKPFGIQIIFIILLLLIPFNRIVIDWDFKWNMAERKEVITKLRAGELKPNVSYNEDLIHLPKKYTHLSKGGGEILMEKDNEQNLVLFFTFRGVLDNFSGFVFSSSDKRPRPTQFGGDIKEIVKLQKHWYYISSY
ncbi:MAG: hypothetical protein ACO1OT_06520 [Heyndrickxia sp.]